MSILQKDNETAQNTPVRPESNRTCNIEKSPVTPTETLHDTCNGAKKKFKTQNNYSYSITHISLFIII